MQHIDFLENTSVLHVNTLAPHCYFIPFGPGEAAESSRECSSRFELLNGNWDFAYYERACEIPDDISSVQFKNTLSVPSNWQLNGYGTPWYTNTRYPFPFDPPYVPHENAAGVFHRKYSYIPDGLRRILTFEGADSCIFLYINGEFAGYSQVSHAAAEFDVSDMLNCGNNDITAVIVRFCDGSYLEDQDKWRLSGIFRDVYMLSRPQNRVEDYRVTTKLKSNGDAEIRLKLRSSAPCTVSLYSPGGDFLEKCPTDETGEYCFILKKPCLWCAEIPQLYSLIIESEDEKIFERIGIREIMIKNGVFTVNGSPVKLRGVNRHDSYPESGYVCSVDQMREDLLQMKRFNVNAIRTAHYPNSPVFYQMMDELGFYVIDEADIESHGCVDSKYPFRDNIAVDSNYSYIALLASDIRFREAILDRVMLLTSRDINRPCVVIWSLGNESGYGKNFEAAADYIHSFDPTRPVHYESTYILDDTDDKVLDMVSFMYPEPEMLKTLLADSSETRPIILCEYCHAKGLGPGDLYEYWNLLYSSDRFIGAFVWEYRDHGIFSGYSESGKPKYLYGGDFGEPYHDGSFCMDGLCYPDSTPHTGLYEMKNIYRPIYAEKLDGHSTFRFTSRLDHMRSDEAAICRYVVEDNGMSVYTGAVRLSLLPRDSETFSIPELEKYIGENTYITFFYEQQYNTAWSREGHILGFDQFMLNRNLSLPLPEKDHSIFLSEDTVGFTVTSGNITYRISRYTALPYSIKKDGEEILNGIMSFNLFRAPTCNDQRFSASRWKDTQLHAAKAKVYEIKAELSNGCAIINARLSLGGGIVPPIARIYLELTIDKNGIRIKTDATFEHSYDYLPRFGIRSFLNRKFDNVEYLGYGPHESYCDMHRASRYSRFSGTVSGMHEDYCVPQENGSHFGTTAVSLSDGRSIINICAEDPFSFSVSPYTQEELTAKNHNFELNECGSTVLCIDAFMSGAGSAACGPALDEQYALTEKNIRFEILIQMKDEVNHEQA